MPVGVVDGRHALRVRDSHGTWSRLEHSDEQGTRHPNDLLRAWFAAGIEASRVRFGSLEVLGCMPRGGPWHAPSMKAFHCVPSAKSPEAAGPLHVVSRRHGRRWVRQVLGSLFLALFGLMPVSLRAHAEARPADLQPRAVLWPFSGPRSTRPRAEACPTDWRVVAVADEASWARALSQGMRAADPDCVLEPLIVSWTDLSPFTHLPELGRVQAERIVLVGASSALTNRTKPRRTYVLGLSERPFGASLVAEDHQAVAPLPEVGYAAGMAAAAWLTHSGPEPATRSTPAGNSVRRFRHRAGSRQVVSVTLRLPPDPASQALLSGLASGLRHEAPGRMALYVEGQSEQPIERAVQARIDPAHPSALITMERAGHVRLVCGIDLSLWVRQSGWLSRFPRAEEDRGQSGWDAWRCTWHPAGRGHAPDGVRDGTLVTSVAPDGETSAVEAALLHAASDLAPGATGKPGWIADYSRPPITIPPGEWPLAKESRPDSS